MIESQVTISCDYAENLPLFKVDRQRLEQVFTNLILNATQAMSGGGEISLQTCLGTNQNGHAPREVIITFSDTGPGIPADNQRQVFEPFFTTKARGTGLGLTVANRIIEEHGGTISIENRTENGARFVIRLPINERAI